jgi:NAD(P)-dependent dehydrogenase (short-subunit alcohol dehydrogenase family)
MLGFEDRVAVITGAGQGLGRAHAELLAARGAAVVLADLPSEDGGSARSAEAATAITEAGGTAVAVGVDVSTSAGGEHLVDAALQAFGRVDIVINNAGIVRDSSFAKLSDADLRAVIDVHLIGAFNVTRPAWRHMRERRYGRILNTTSNAGLLGNFGQSNYAAAKTGLVGLTRVLAIEGAKHGITVNALAPMGKTPMTEGVEWDVFDALEPDQVSAVAAWLVHDKCKANGQIFGAAGGHVARYFIGRTRGHFDPGLTPELVRDRFEAICDTDGFAEFGSATEEIEALAELLAERVGEAG